MVWESTDLYFAVDGLGILGAPQLSHFPSREIAFCLALAVPGLGAPATVQPIAKLASASALTGKLG